MLSTQRLSSHEAWPIWASQEFGWLVDEQAWQVLAFNPDKSETGSRSGYAENQQVTDRYAKWKAKFGTLTSKEKGATMRSAEGFTAT